MGVTGAQETLTKPKGRSSRGSKKKRRTEISSSEESSSSSSSEDDEKMDDVKPNNTDAILEIANVVETEINDDIDELEVPSKQKTQRDALETKLKLSAVARGLETQTTGSVSPEEWVTEMVTQYGEEIDLLRHSNDFKDSSVAQVAQLLRETRHVIE